MFTNRLNLANLGPMAFTGVASQPCPTTVGPYRLLHRLGRGGEGIVYAAEHSSLGERVAIKLIPLEAIAEITPFQILHAARLASQVRHPHVVSLHDAGTYVGGVYLAMELVEGLSVQELMGKGPLAWREATEILVDACEGLAALHDRGMIHRDVKPANLLCAANGVVKLADFGLACWTSPSKRMVFGKQLGGTPHFMSPEQCRDDQCDERSDVYSLGATYYAMLTGTLPFSGAQLLQIMFAHCSAPAPNPRNVVRDIPRSCAEIVQKAMAKKRADRYASAREVQTAMRAALSATHAGQQNIPRRSCSPCRKDVGTPTGWRN